MQRIADNLTTNGLGMSTPLTLPTVAPNLCVRTPSDEFDCVFWLGDLNYRVDMERSEVDQHIQQQSSWTVSLPASR